MKQIRCSRRSRCVISSFISENYRETTNKFRFCEIQQIPEGERESETERDQLRFNKEQAAELDPGRNSASLFRQVGVSSSLCFRGKLKPDGQDRTTMKVLRIVLSYPRIMKGGLEVKRFNAERWKVEVLNVVRPRMRAVRMGAS